MSTKDAAKVIRATHAMCMEYTDGDVFRSMTLARLSDGNFGVILETTWNKGDEPFSTKIMMSPEGLRMLTSLLCGVHQIHEFPVPDNG